MKEINRVRTFSRHLINGLFSAVLYALVLQGSLTSLSRGLIPTVCEPFIVHLLLQSFLACAGLNAIGSMLLGDGIKRNGMGMSAFIVSMKRYFIFSILIFILTASSFMLEKLGPAVSSKLGPGEERGLMWIFSESPALGFAVTSFWLAFVSIAAYTFAVLISPTLSKRGKSLNDIIEERLANE